MTKPLHHKIPQTMLVAILLLTLVAPSWGQQPPTRRAPPPPREQRRERLRELGGGLLDNLVKPLLADSKEQARGVDVGKVNTQVATLLEGLIAGDTAVETLQLGFDPEQTRLEEDTIALRGVLGLKHSAWSHEPSHAEVKLHGHLDQGPSGPPQAVLEGSLHVETEVVPLVAMALDKARAKLKTEPLPKLPTAKQMTDQRLAVVLADVPPPRTMDDVADLFTLTAAEQMPAFVAEISELKYVLDTQELEPEEREKLEARLAATRLQRDRLFETHPRIHRDESGRVQAITVLMENSEAITGMHVNNLELEVTEHDIHGKFSASAQRGAQTYLLIKPLAFGMLKRFQDRDPELSKQTEGMSRWYYTRARDELIGREF